MSAVRIELSDDPRDFVGRDWSDLVAADSAGTFFHTPRYLKLYWEEFGGDVELRLAFAVRNGRTVGAAAFEVDGTTLRFLGGTEVTDYLGPVALPADADAVAEAMIETIARWEGWSSADWEGIPEDSPWLRRLGDFAGRMGLHPAVSLDDVAPCLPVFPSYEAYLRGLPAKLRHEIGRKARRLDAEAGAHRLAFATRESLGRDLDTFVGWHRSSEGPKGKFMQPGMEIFFRRLGEAFIDQGAFRLAFVEAEGEKLAGAIGFAFGGTFHLYNSAFDQSRRSLAPGMVLVADLIEWALDSGCRTFDMLKGDLAYKYRFGAVPRRIMRLTLRR